MVLTPRVCCIVATKAGFEGAVRPVRAYFEADMRVLRWVAGDVNWQVIEDRRARLKLREAMIDVQQACDCNEFSI